jgi:hypothetical protein
VQHDFGETAELTTTLAHALADVTGVDVTETGFVLADYVDPDALDDLFRPVVDGTIRPSGHLCFDIWGYRVAVYSDGRIVISGSQQRPRPRTGPYR